MSNEENKSDGFWATILGLCIGGGLAFILGHYGYLNWLF